MPVRLPALLRNSSARGLPGLRTAKLTLAAVLAYLLAARLDTTPDRILGPLTALLVVRVTVLETFAHALGRVVSVLSGVLVAVGVAHLLGLTWWSLGAVVLASLVVGQLLHLRENLLEVPISAMIVLAVGGATASATGRVVETLLGAGVGLAVNLVIAPPLHVRPAERAAGRLAEALAATIEELAADVREGWSRPVAQRWVQRSRDLRHDVDDADRDLQQAEQSARLNPRGGQARGARPRLRAGVSGLEHCAVGLHSLCRAMLDRALSVDDRDEPYRDEIRVALADVLRSSAEAVRAVGVFSAAASPVDAVRASVSAVADRLRGQRDRLAGLLLVDPVADQGAWQAHGALLAAVDRLRVEVEAAMQPADQQWRPPPLAERQRAAVRRLVAPARRRGG